MSSLPQSTSEPVVSNVESNGDHVIAEYDGVLIGKAIGFGDR
jgi:hypothetical protein